MDPKHRNLSAATKLAIVQLFEKNVTQAEIARLLELNKSIVSQVLHRHNECGSVENRSRTGRPPLLLPRAKGVLFGDVKKSRNAPLQEIMNIFNQGRTRRVSMSKSEECPNVLYNELFVRKVIKGWSLGRQFSSVYQTKGTEWPGARASCICRDWLLGQSNTQR